MIMARTCCFAELDTADVAALTLRRCFTKTRRSKAQQHDRVRTAMGAARMRVVTQW